MILKDTIEVKLDGRLWGVSDVQLPAGKVWPIFETRATLALNILELWMLKNTSVASTDITLFKGLSQKLRQRSNLLKDGVLKRIHRVSSRILESLNCGC